MDAMYLDKLDGRINAAFHDRKATEWRAEQERVQQAVSEHQAANRGYLDSGIKLLELASRAEQTFLDREPDGRRELLRFMVSNCTWKEDRTNYYCLVLWQEVDADLLAEQFTERCLPPDTIRWGYRPLYEQELFAAWGTTCPNAEAVVRSTFQLPIHSGMTTAELDCIRQAIIATGHVGR